VGRKILSCKLNWPFVYSCTKSHEKQGDWNGSALSKMKVFVDDKSIFYQSKKSSDMSYSLGEKKWSGIKKWGKTDHHIKSCQSKKFARHSFSEQAIRKVANQMWTQLFAGKKSAFLMWQCHWHFD